MRWCKGLLDGARADPPKQVERAAGFVVRSASSSPAEGLLTDHGARGLVVDVEVPSAVAERLDRRLNVASVGGKDGPREGVLRGRVAQFQRGFKVLVGVDVNRENRTEDFLGHGLAAWVVAHDGRGLNEVARAVVVGAAGDDLTIRVGSGAVDVARDAIEGLLVDDGAEEVAEVRHVAHGDLVDLGDVVILDGVPHRAWHVDAACSAALLALELKSSAEHGHEQGLAVAIGVGHDEVLAARFADDARVGFQVLEVVGHVSPHLAENSC